MVNLPFREEPFLSLPYRGINYWSTSWSFIDPSQGSVCTSSLYRNLGKYETVVDGEGSRSPRGSRDTIDPTEPRTHVRYSPTLPLPRGPP